MAYAFNPTPAESNTLAQIAQRESAGNYTSFTQLPNSHASGAYQFQPGTWQYVASQTGVGTEYANAGDAPAWMQDANALWLLRAYGPNASISWGASGPYDTSSGGGSIPGSSTQPLIDLSGSASTSSTSDILSSINQSAAAAGLDLTNPATGIMLAASAGLALYLMTRR